MSKWKIEKLTTIPKLKDPICIEGLPGIGNVGKVAVDYLIDELKPTKSFGVFSYHFPHSVFVTEDNLVELPSITLYIKKRNGRDLIFLAGDVQPTDEVPSYEFSEFILGVLQKLSCKEIITLGGIGLPAVPKNPKVYITGNSKKLIEYYSKGVSVDTKLYGIVGPIVGVSGLLLGLSKKKNMQAVSFLAETYGHPMYLGMKGAREIVSVLNSKLNLGISLDNFDSEIDQMEKEQSKDEGLSPSMLKKLKGKLGPSETSYIG